MLNGPWLCSTHNITQHKWLATRAAAIAVVPYSTFFVAGCTVTGCTVAGCSFTGCTVTGCTVAGCTTVRLLALEPALRPALMAPSTAASRPPRRAAATAALTATGDARMPNLSDMNREPCLPMTRSHLRHHSRHSSISSNILA